MRKALTITLVAALALFAGSAAYANYCARDVVPASTILVPWAVQDMANGSPDTLGYTTILTITNVSSEAQIIHITVWNAVSVPCLDFDEVLTGYDVWQIWFRDMLAGNFGIFDTDNLPGVPPDIPYPVAQRPSGFLGVNFQNPNVDPDGAGFYTREPFEWGPDGQSAFSGASALPLPETVGPLPDTNCFMPYGNGVNVTSNVTCLRNPLNARVHAGCGNLQVRGDFDNDWLHTLTNDPLFFYVTIDVVNACNFDFPSVLNYYSTRYVPENVLIGDIIYLSALDNNSEAISAVHIESDPDVISTTDVNFYDPQADPDSSFFLEPLATAFAFNYYDIAATNVSSDVIVWKNYSDFHPTNINLTNVDDCGYYLYYAWDQDEHTNTRAGACRISPCNPNDIDPNEFPFETQKVPLTLDNFDLADTAGWMLVVFFPSYYNAPAVWTDPTPGNLKTPTQLQAWVGTRIDYGSYSAALEAATMASYHCFAGQVLPALGVDWDYDPPTE